MKLPCILSERLFSLCCFSALIYAACIEAPRQDTHLRSQRYDLSPWTHRLISEKSRSLKDRTSPTHNCALDTSAHHEKKTHASTKSHHKDMDSESRAMGIRPLVLPQIRHGEIVREDVPPHLRRIRGGEGDDADDDDEDEEKAGNWLFFVVVRVFSHLCAW